MLNEFEKREILQSVIDRMLYCENYIKYLKELNENFKVKNRFLDEGKVVIKNKFDERGRIIKY